MVAAMTIRPAVMPRQDRHRGLADLEALTATVAVMVAPTMAAAVAVAMVVVIATAVVVVTAAARIAKFEALMS
jgi:hypothetical protein